MSTDTYEKAHKLAIRDFQEKTSIGNYPYLKVLSELLSYTNIVSEENLGLVSIPLGQVVGTKTAGHTNAFASNFMPLLAEETEFALKWKQLYESQKEEGIHEPVKAYEFMNRFYVEEGNKRVSVLKYCNAVSVPAYVTRLIPERNDSVESRIYYEFLDFYKKTEINYVNFSQPGSYLKLTDRIGIPQEREWSEQERMQFRSSYIRFTDIFEKKGGNKLSLTHGDAFLVYLEIYGYDDFPFKTQGELRQDIAKIWNDFVLYPEKTEVRLIMNAASSVEKRIFTRRILQQDSLPLKVAFIHTKTVAASGWTYGHELGRGHVDQVMGKQVETSVYMQADSPEEEIRCFEQAIADGNTVIFSTSPKLLATSIKYAMKYPKLKIINCSLDTSCKHLRTYYGRLYEAKFLIGAIAGIMSETDTIGYIADYPIYGMISNINAFALGAKMVNPNAKIYLEWSKLKPEFTQENMKKMGISLISGQDFVQLENQAVGFGLFETGKKHHRNLAMPVWNWGAFYEKAIRSIWNGTWEQEVPRGGNDSVNYWWGMSSGMIDVICSMRIPTGTRQLVEVLKQSIYSGEFSPFSGTIYSQQGLVHNSMTEGLTAGEIMTMDWLADNVIGSIPTMDDLEEDAKPIVQLQGVAKARGDVLTDCI